MRTTIARSIQLGSWVGPTVFVLGVFLPGSARFLGMTVGVLLFTATALLALVTLPVELDASRRAKRQLVSQRLIAPGELSGVSAMLSAAALTYVAAAVRAVASLVYWGPSRRL
jgi:Zn-dependent membrane protease YugP